MILLVLQDAELSSTLSIPYQLTLNHKIVNSNNSPYAYYTYA